MKSGEFTIAFAEGLHARPASELVRICQKAKSDIRLTKDESTINPKSILGIMSLGAANGTVVKLEVEGEDEEDIFSNIKAFFEANIN
jgi:phosphocarrier protein